MISALRFVASFVRGHPIIPLCCSAAIFSGDHQYLLILGAAMLGVPGMYLNVAYKNAIGDADRLLLMLDRAGTGARLEMHPQLLPAGAIQDAKIVSIAGATRVIDQAVAMDLREFGKIILVPPHYGKKPLHRFLIAHELRHVSGIQTFHDASISMGWMAVFTAALAFSLCTGKVVLPLIIAAISLVWHRIRCLSDTFTWVREMDADNSGVMAFDPGDRKAIATRILDMWGSFATLAAKSPERNLKKEEWLLRRDRLQRAFFQFPSTDFRGRFLCFHHPLLDDAAFLFFAALGYFAVPMVKSAYWALYAFVFMLLIQAVSEVAKWRMRAKYIKAIGL